MSISTKSIGSIRILSTKFFELRKEYQENRKTDKVIEVGSSLNDNGKTRYLCR
jgi:hypothetical protein